MATNAKYEPFPCTVILEWVVPDFLEKLKHKGSMKMEFLYPHMFRIDIGERIPPGFYTNNKIRFSFDMTDTGSISCLVSLWHGHSCSRKEQRIQERRNEIREDDVSLEFSICGTPDLTFSQQFPDLLHITGSQPLFQGLPESRLQDATKGYMHPTDGSVKFKLALVDKRVMGRPKANITSLDNSREIVHEPAADVDWGVEDAYNSQQCVKDVTLEAGDGTKIETSKFMLSVHSAVFFSMFQHDTLEELTNRVVIPDTDGETLSHFVECVSTGTVPRSAETAIKLMTVADKYLMNTLKDSCATTLLRLMNAGNVLEILGVAADTGADGLKRAAFQHVCSSAEPVTSFTSWRKVREERPVIIDELFEYMQKKLNRTGDA